MTLVTPGKFKFLPTKTGYVQCLEALNEELSQINMKMTQPLSQTPTESLPNLFKEIGDHLVNLKMLGEALGVIIKIMETKETINQDAKGLIEGLLGRIIYLHARATPASYLRSLTKINEDMTSLNQYSSTLELLDFESFPDARRSS